MTFSVIGQKVDQRDFELIQDHQKLQLFDYRLHRNPAHALYHLTLNDTSNRTYLHLFYGNPIIALSRDSIQLFRLKPPELLQQYKLDLQLKPLYYTELGNYEDPFRLQIAVGPRIQVNFHRGWYGVFQWIIPIYNEFDSRLGFAHRPGEVGLGRVMIFKSQHFVNAYAGTFTNNQYGGYGEYVYMTKNGKWYFGGAFFYTGQFLYNQGVLYRDHINYLSGYGFISYRFVNTGLNVRLLAERYLRNDEGISLEVIRQFGNTDIGFFASKTRFGDNAGVFVSFALWPRKFYQNNWIQIRLPHTFRSMYHLRPNTGIAQTVRPYTDFFYDIYRFNPHYLQHQINENQLFE